MESRRNVRAALVVALVLFLAALAGPAMAQGGPGEVPTFDAFLAGLSGPLVSAAAAVVLSIVVEYWPQYEAMDSKHKRLIYFGMCLVVPLGAAGLRAGLGYVPFTFDPLMWSALWNGAAAGGIGTLAHTRKL